MRAVQIRTVREPGIVLEVQGAYPVRPSLPSVVGNEGMGRVLAIGRGVDHLKVGDRVRERPVAPAAGLFALPEGDPRQLAMLGINPPTAALLLKSSPGTLSAGLLQQAGPTTRAPARSTSAAVISETVIWDMCVRPTPVGRLPR